MRILWILVMPVLNFYTINASLKNNPYIYMLRMAWKYSKGEKIRSLGCILGL